MSDNKKELLNEAQIRQFMKLAQLQPLSNAFINEATPADPRELEELRTGRTGALGPPDGTRNSNAGRGQGEAASGAQFEQLEPGLEDEPEVDVDLGDAEAAEDELEADVELGDEAAGARVVDVDEFLSALEVALENVLGDEVEIDSDEVEDVEDVALDVDVEDAGVEVEDEVELQEGDDEELEESPEADSDLVEQITKRVAARILRAALNKK